MSSTSAHFKPSGILWHAGAIVLIGFITGLDYLFGFKDAAGLIINAVCMWIIFFGVSRIVAAYGDSPKYEQPSSVVDESTKSISRQAFTIFLASEVKRTARYNRSLTLAYVDINDLDEVSKKYGPASVDRLLITVADTMKKNLRASDNISRLKNNEFAILLPETNQRQAQVVMAKVQHELAEAMEKNQWKAAMNIGIVTCLGQSSMDELVQQADMLRNEPPSADNSVIKSRTILKEVVDIKITGVNEDLTEKAPLLANKYNVYFKLSEYPSLRWEELFDEEKKLLEESPWSHAWISGRHIVAQCALAELNQNQLDLIKESINNINKRQRVSQMEVEMTKAEAQKLREEEKKKKHDVLGSLVFEEPEPLPASATESNVTASLSKSNASGTNP